MKVSELLVLLRRADPDDTVVILTDADSAARHHRHVRRVLSMNLHQFSFDPGDPVSGLHIVLMVGAPVPDDLATRRPTVYEARQN